MTQRHTEACPIAHSLNIIGDRWTLLIVREAFGGISRFSDFQKRTGIAKNLLTDRLALLVQEGIFDKADIGERGVRYAYHLTEKGRSLLPVMVALHMWGNENLFEDGEEPVLLVDRTTGEPIQSMAMLTSSGASVLPENIRRRPGPGAPALKTGE